jgi:hypothetical protein
LLSGFSAFVTIWQRFFFATSTLKRSKSCISARISFAYNIMFSFVIAAFKVLSLTPHRIFTLKSARHNRLTGSMCLVTPVVSPENDTLLIDDVRDDADFSIARVEGDEGEAARLHRARGHRHLARRAGVPRTSV